MSPFDSRAAASVSATMSEARRALHCLVVEDNPTNQFVITLFLRKLGVTHHLVNRGCEALHALSDGAYDLVLMDIEMPVLDGYATTRELRRREAASGGGRIPVIALSADALPDSVQRAHEAGMDRFLTKPIAMEDLDAALSAVAAFGDAAALRP